MSKAHDDLLTLARLRIKQAEDADSAQDERERQDLSFYEGEGQWPSDIKAAREGQQAVVPGETPTPARPCLTINKTREPIRHVLNQERQSDLGIEVIPADDFAELTGPIDATEIELREGLIRRIQRQSDAADARSWAFSRATIAGRGYYGLMTRYAKGKSFDQEIYYRRFYNQAAVKLDPAHEMPDGSDAEWGFVGSYMPWDKYKSTYKKVANGKSPNDLVRYADTDFQALCKDEPKWFTEDGKLRMVRIVEYWYTTYTSRTLVTLEDGSVAWEDETQGAKVKMDEDGSELKRPVLDRAIKFAKLDGKNVLEETDWPGKYIPIIKVVGEEIQPFDAERRYEGMIRPARDPQRGFNFMVTAEVEAIGIVPKQPMMLDPEQIEGYEEVWKQANTRIPPYLPRKSFNQVGNPYLPIQRAPAEPDIQAIAVAIREFDQGIKTTLGVPDATLGNVDPSIRSGRGIKALQDQAEQGTSHFLDNLNRSEHYEALILNDLLAPIFNRPGRLARILNPQLEPQTVMLHQPFVMQGDGKHQKPVRFDPQQHQGQQPKTYTLTPDGEFNVAVKVTKSFDTRRQEIEQTLTELVSGDPQATLPFFADLLFKYSDAPGHREMEERGKLMLAPPVQAALHAAASGQPGPSPEVQQLQQQVQQLQQALQTEQVKQQAMLQKAQLENQTSLQIAREANQTKVQIAEISGNSGIAEADIKAGNADLDRRLKLVELFLTAQKEARLDAESKIHEAATQGRDHAHELKMAVLDHQHAMKETAAGLVGDAALADQSHQQGLEAADQGQAHALEQGQQAADLAPEPSSNGSGS